MAALYQIIREAVNGAIRRGPPTRIEVRVEQAPDGGLETVVSDDRPGSGDGRPSTPWPSGLGRERPVSVDAPRTAARPSTSCSRRTRAGEPRDDRFGAVVYLVFVVKPTGYELHEREGDPPQVGERVEYGDRSYWVSKVSTSPLPGDGRRCAYLQA